MKVVVFLFLSLQYLIAMATEMSPRPCAEAPSHVEQRSCLDSLYQKTDASLIQVEKSFIEKLANWDEEPHYRLQSRKAFKASISAFRAYRSSQCEYFWTLAAGGNGATDMKLSCAIELTESRIKQLDEYSRGIVGR
jgi:uncharacterized protein YecT (DUF1311 family)